METSLNVLSHSTSIFAPCTFITQIFGIGATNELINNNNNACLSFFSFECCSVVHWISWKYLFFNGRKMTTKFDRPNILLTFVIEVEKQSIWINFSIVLRQKQLKINKKQKYSSRKLKQMEISFSCKRVFHFCCIVELDFVHFILKYVL